MIDDRPMQDQWYLRSKVLPFNLLITKPGDQVYITDESLEYLYQICSTIVVVRLTKSAPPGESAIVVRKPGRTSRIKGETEPTPSIPGKVDRKFAFILPPKLVLNLS